MSAIAGLYHLDGRPVDQPALVRMVASLAHRGPDGSGLWQTGSIGLGHQLLWTTPAVRCEPLPRANARGDLVITADARIDNREELSACLRLDGRPAGPLDDGAVILAAYARWGEACPAQLLGDFAFAIWDGRRQVLFCARDQIGVKPFYYYHATGQLFAFASEIKALLSLPQVPRRVNEAGVADFLAGWFDDPSGTLYQAISRLPPGHTLTVGRAGARLRRYYALDPAFELPPASDEAYAEGFRERFTAAVRRRVRGAAPVGAALSGGLDSSAIACTARQVLAANGNRRLATFSAIFPDLPAADLRRIDERQYIEAVLATGGFEAHVVHADRLSPLGAAEKVLWHTDEAYNAPNLYLHWALYERARQQGVRVFLDGIDGDTTVSHGVAYLAELVWRGRWRTLMAEATALASRSPGSFTARRIIWQYGLRPLAPDPAVWLWRTLRGQRPPLAPPGTTINPELARRVGLAERSRARWVREGVPQRSARADHVHGLTSPLIPYVLELADKAAAAFALEPRYPFFDRQLIEYCLALPGHQKLRGGWTRAILRRAMDGILPAAIQWRSDKANLSPNFRRGLLQHEHDLLETVILQEPRRIQRFVDVPALQAAYRRFRDHPLHSNQDAVAVFRAATLALWLRTARLATD